MIFLHSTLVQDEAPPHEVWIQKVEQFKRHYVDKHYSNLGTLGAAMKLILNTYSSALYTGTALGFLPLCALYAHPDIIVLSCHSVPYMLTLT